MIKYKILRHYRDLSKRATVVRRGLSLEEAQKHCRDPNTSTEIYFDGYTVDIPKKIRRKK